MRVCVFVRACICVCVRTCMCILCVCVYVCTRGEDTYIHEGSVDVVTGLSINRDEERQAAIHRQDVHAAVLVMVPGEQSHATVFRPHPGSHDVQSLEREDVILTIIIRFNEHIFGGSYKETSIFLPRVAEYFHLRHLHFLS